MNAREAGRWLRDEFEAAGIDDATLEAELLVRWAGRLTRAQYFADAEIDCKRLPLVGIGLKRRLAREPLAYITGAREFYGRPFAVTSAVLVPRPETELLVELALADLERVHEPVVVDVGTGSGCVAISVALEAPGVQVVGVDVSAAALAVAITNAMAFSAPVAFVRGSLLESIGAADIVLANLPYVPTSDIEGLAPEVRAWEPRRALDGGCDGLDLVRELVADCGSRVRPKLLAMEVGAGQAPEVAVLVAAAGGSVSVHRDLAGIERVLCGRWA